MPNIEKDAIIATSIVKGSIYADELRFSREAMEDVVGRLLDGSLRRGWQHDPRRHADYTVLDAWTEDADDGSVQVWAKLSIDESEWDDYLKGLEEAGAPGGWSITFTTPITHIDAETPDGGISIVVAADAYHWSVEEIEAAGRVIATVADVDLQERFELAADPNAVVHLVIVLHENLAPILDGVVGTALFTAMRRFLRPSGEKTIFHFDVEKPDMKARAYLETKDPEVLRRAMGSFDRLTASDEETAVWDEEAEEWSPPDDNDL